MQHAHEQYPAWLAWFLDPSTTDEEELQRALQSVPDTSWSSVKRDIGWGLLALSAEEQGSAGHGQEDREGDFPVALSPTLDVKRHLLSKEGTRRLVIASKVSSKLAARPAHVPWVDRSQLSLPASVAR